MISETIIVSEISDIPPYIRKLSDDYGIEICNGSEMPQEKSLILRVSADGLSLESGGQSMRCDLDNMVRRLKRSKLSSELLVRAAKIKNADMPLSVIDATAGLGEDSLLLAAAGFKVNLYERNPVIAALLYDALERAKSSGDLKNIVCNMELFGRDSIEALDHLEYRPDVIYLDPMFPEKTKKSLTKKKFQLLHHLESPCSDEGALLGAALRAHPRKIVIKRPLKGDYLAGKKPDYSLTGKTIRYDCIVFTE